MSKTRVLIVDDAVVVRRMVANLLEEGPDFEVAGTAPNGWVGLVRIGQVRPDVVLLDVEMPEMDGLEMLAALRKTHPHLPVIMLSRFTKRGAAATLDALALGANDYVTMPDHAGGPPVALQELAAQLIPKLKQFGRQSRMLASPAPAAPAPSGQLRPPADSAFRPRTAVEVVAIGASTGGPNALTTVLSTFPADFSVPVVVVQHMPPVFTRLLAERLCTLIALEVREAVAGEALTPGTVWLAPGDYHLVLARDGTSVRLGTHQGPAENSCRPSVDVLLRSVADVYGAGVLAVVLTGMGHDGLRGCERVCEAGGQVLVQDEASSVVWGMPGFVARAGLADAVLPLPEVGGEIVRRVRRGRTPSTLGLRLP